MKISLVILTWNERDCLEAVIPRIPRDSVDEIFVVDGGSTDGTVEYFQSHGIRVVKQTERGRGAAFFVAAKEATGDALLFFSPDGNEDPADIPKFRAYLDQGYDLVIASRMMPGAYNEEDSSWFRPRKWANNILNALVNIFFRRTGPWVTDSINGFRAITKKAFTDIKPDSMGYSIEYQMTIRAFKHRLRIVEFPTHESPRVAGETKAPSIKTGFQFLYLLLCELVSPFGPERPLRAFERLASIDSHLVARWYALVLVAACFGWPLVLGIGPGWPRAAWLIGAVILVGWSIWFARRAAQTAGSFRVTEEKPPYILFLIAGVVCAVVVIFPVTFFGDEDLIALPSLIIAARIAKVVTWPGLTILTLIGLSAAMYWSRHLRDWHVWLFSAVVLCASAILAVIHLHPEMLMVRYPPLMHFVQFVATALGQGSPEFLRIGNAFWVIALGFVAWYAAHNWPPVARLAAALSLCLTPLGWTYHILLYQACGELTIGFLAAFLIASLLRQQRDDSDMGGALVVGITFAFWILYRPTALALACVTIVLLVFCHRWRSAWTVANITLPVGALWILVYGIGSFQYSFFSIEESRAFPIITPLFETVVDLAHQLSIPGIAILLLGGIFSLWKRPQDRWLLLVAWLLAVTYTGLHEILTLPTWYGYGRFNVLLMLPLAVTVGSVIAWFRSSKIAAVVLLAPLLVMTPWSTVNFLQSYRSTSHLSRITRTVTGGVSPTPFPRALEDNLSNANTFIMLAPSFSILDLSIARGQISVQQRNDIINRSNAWTITSKDRPVLIQAPAVGMTYQDNISSEGEKRLLEAAAWARTQPNVKIYRLGTEETIVVP